MGGEGTVLGTFLGVLTLAIVENGLILARIPSYWHQVIVGGVILTAVSVDVIQVKRRERRLARIHVENEEADS
jgi:simple sugar transport system permease protein/ribose transport system permease protein